MNNSFDFNSKKYVILLLLICVLFVIFIIKMYEEYMPKPLNDNDSYSYREEQVTEVNQTAESYNSEEVESSKYDTKEHKTGHLDFMPKQSREEETQYEEIDTPPGAKEDIPAPSVQTTTQTSGLTTEEQALRCIINGQNYKASSDYANALNEFQNAADMADNNELKAMSFEAIAEIYARQRRFGTALSFANKAYNLSPTSSREMLISRIYYKSGDTDRGIKMLNSLIQKGF